jgi:pantoate--beta-alanine ligase
VDICNTITEMRERVAAWRRAGERIAFVPTMGNLHAGHIHLTQQARICADRVIASVFVNPTQFGPTEDFAKYPRTLAHDIEQLKAAGVDALFAPSVDEIYPQGRGSVTRVDVGPLGNVLCGASRPGHFNGVALVVSKLFNIVSPDVALFGEKDYQQLAVIRQLVHDLNFSIQILGVPTVRAEDGLALSSRNGYLTAEERQRASQLYATLSALRDILLSGRRDYEVLERQAMERLITEGFRPDYVAIRNLVTLDSSAPDDAAWVVLAAAYLGNTRLIDNVLVGSL